MSLKKFQALKPEHQKAFLSAALKAAAYERKLIRDNEAKQLADLKAAGMQVDNVDKAVFVKAMSPVYDQFAKQYPNWKPIIEKIQATQ
jgi:TRAP-type C4-dicarboxylate transport system substrate-binding protein